LERYQVIKETVPKKILNFLVFFFLIFPIFTFSTDTNAELFVSKLSKDAKVILSNKSSDIQARQKQLDDLSLNNVDLDAVANYTLGEYRQKLSDSEKSTFKGLFKDYFVKNVSSKLHDFADQDLKVIGSKKLNETNILVNTKIFSKKDGQEIIVDWRIYFSNNKYLVRDLVVEGLSLARTQREEFASILYSKGFPELVKILENFIKSN